MVFKDSIFHADPEKLYAPWEKLLIICLISSWNPSDSSIFTYLKSLLTRKIDTLAPPAKLLQDWNLPSILYPLSIEIYQKILGTRWVTIWNLRKLTIFGYFSGKSTGKIGLWDPKVGFSKNWIQTVSSIRHSRERFGKSLELGGWPFEKILFFE